MLFLMRRNGVDGEISGVAAHWSLLSCRSSKFNKHLPKILSSRRVLKVTDSRYKKLWSSGGFLEFVSVARNLLLLLTEIALFLWDDSDVGI